MFYSAIVVSVDDEKLNGRIRVYIPKLMPLLQEESTKEVSLTTGINATNILSDNGVDTTVVNVTEAQTVTASPFNFNGSTSNGSLIIPEKGDVVSVFFMNDDMSQCYYTCGSPYIDNDNNLDYAVEAESKNDNHLDKAKKPKQKVIYKSAQGSIIYIDDNVDTLSLLLKANDYHKIKLERNVDNSEIALVTGNGHKLIIDEKNDHITMESSNGNKLKINDANDIMELSSATSVDITAPTINLKGTVVTTSTLTTNGAISDGTFNLSTHNHTGDSGGSTSGPQ